jgi:hypothetical protein
LFAARDGDGRLAGEQLLIEMEKKIAAMPSYGNFRRKDGRWLYGFGPARGKDVFVWIKNR